MTVFISSYFYFTHHVQNYDIHWGISILYTNITKIINNRQYNKDKLG